MSKKSPLRRPACGLTSISDPDLWFGGCRQIYENIPYSYELYSNVTKVPRLDTASADPIEPYERPLEPEYLPNCSAYKYTTCGEGTNGFVFCGLPDTNSVDVAPTGTRVRVTPYYNSYSDTNTTASTPPCGTEIIGVKTVTANKQWHGLNRYTSRDYGAVDTMTYCCGCMVHNEDTSPETTKYLRIEGTGSYELKQTTRHLTDDDPPTAYDVVDISNAHAYSDSVVGRFTGCVTNTCSSSSVFAPPYDSFTVSYLVAQAISLMTYGSWNITQPQTAYCNKIADINALTTSHSIEGGGDSITLTTWRDFTIYVDGDYVVSTLPEYIVHFDTTGFYYDRWASTYNYDTGYADREQIEHEEFSIGDTSITYHAWTSFSPSEGLRQVGTWDFTSTLTLPYTVSDVQDDLQNLASQIELGDDALPWRTDTDLTNGPLLTYAEKGGGISPALWQCDVHDDTYRFDGSVKGKLNPIGYGKFWNADFENWHICDDGLGPPIKYPETYGNLAPDAYPYATQWTNIQMGTTLFDSAFNGSSFIFTDGIASLTGYWLTKRAEILIDKPSFNFARPAGKDRLLLEVDSERCIVTIDGNTLSLEPTGNPTTINTGDKVFVAGTSTVNGVWNCNKDSDFQITLTSLIASGSLYTQQPPYEGGSGFIGKLKWWNTAPGILGRIDIVDITNSAPITCSLLESCNLAIGDTVIVAGSRGTVSLNGTWTVQDMIDDRNIVLNGSNGVSQSYVNSSAQMYSNGATDYAFNDSAPKHEYISLKWKSNFRDVGEHLRLIAQHDGLISQSLNCEPSITESVDTCPAPYVSPEPRPYQGYCGLQQDVNSYTPEQHCLPYNGCKPSVVYNSPNSESLLDSKYQTANRGWEWAGMDEKYGTLWCAVNMQYDDDYLLQAGPWICAETEWETFEANCRLLDDNGGCQGDDITPCKHYFAKQVIEPRISIPTIAGMSPNNTSTYEGKITTSSISSLNASPVCPNQRVYSRPSNDNHNYSTAFKNSYFQRPYHDVYLAMKSCVCGEGRFANEYRKENVSCD